MEHSRIFCIVSGGEKGEKLQFFGMIRLNDWEQ